MVEKSSSFLGCFNPCKFGLQNFNFNQVRPSGLGLFDGAFPDDMGECEECKTRFTFLKRKKFCNDCGLSYCSSCVSRIYGGQRQCRKCKILGHWPINKAEISSLRVRDLRHFLSTCKVPTNTYKEKQELIDLAIVQLRIKRFGYNYNPHSQSTSATTSRDLNGPSSSTSAATTTSFTTDDGIRVRPQSSNSPETNSEAAVTSTSSSSATTLGASGIRVFPSTSDALQDGQASSNVDHSDDTSSSSWSLLQTEGLETSSSSESLHNSSDLEHNPSSNLHPDNDSDILQEVIPTPSDTERNRSEEPDSQGAEWEITHQPVTSSSHPPDSRMTSVLDVIKLSSLADEEAIKDLSVRQCKEILTLHRVDFSGVWEKHELVNKVVLLWRDFKERQGEKDWTEDQLCKICMDAAIDCVLLECGHMLSCTNCGKQMAECPICRQNVVRVVKTFRA